jgi:hypothetical protein
MEQETTALPKVCEGLELASSPSHDLRSSALSGRRLLRALPIFSVPRHPRI